jgi:hypothetical protein
MPWQLKAEGHALSEAAEKKLFRLLGKVLGDDKAGTAGPAVFTGDHVSGNVVSPQDQELAKPPVEDTDDEEAPPAGLVQKGATYPTQTAEVKAEA